jgi:hypothetical protein
MAENRFTLGVRGPDGDNLVWLTYVGADKRGMVRLGRSGEPASDRAALIRNDSQALSSEFGNLVHAPA